MAVIDTKLKNLMSVSVEGDTFKIFITLKEKLTDDEIILWSLHGIDYRSINHSYTFIITTDKNTINWISSRPIVISIDDASYTKNTDFKILKVDTTLFIKSIQSAYSKFSVTVIMTKLLTTDEENQFLNKDIDLISKNKDIFYIGEIYFKDIEFLSNLEFVFKIRMNEKKDNSIIQIQPTTTETSNTITINSYNPIRIVKNIPGYNVSGYSN